MPDAEMEAEVRAYVESGGILLHSVAEWVEITFGISSHPHAPDSFGWEEKIVTSSPEFVAYEAGDVRARYLGDGLNAYVTNPFGRGEIHSFGFDYGYAYGAKEHLPVARQYKKENHYPLTVAARTPVDKLLEESGLSQGRRRGVEVIPFEAGTLYVNHTPYTQALASTEVGAISTFEGFDGVHLPGRHAALVLR